MMRFWSRWGASRLDDFADGIRPELREIPVPRATEALLARVIASRAAGARVILPHADQPRSRRALRYATAAVAAAVVIGMVSRLGTRQGGANDVAAPPPFWFASVAAAQTSVAALPAVRVTVPERLHAFAARYVRTVGAERGAAVTSAQTDVRMERDSSLGVAGWRVVSSRATVADGHHSVDTVRVAAVDLRLLSVVAREAPYSSFTRIRVAQRFDGLRVIGEMTADRVSGPAAHRTFDRQLSPGHAPYVPDAIAPIFLMGVQMGPTWRGRLSILGWAVRDDDVSMAIDLRVDGEETIRVPAGTFECWRVAIDVGGRRQWHWVRKSDGLGVRSLGGRDGAGRSGEISLVSEARP